MLHAHTKELKQVINRKEKCTALVYARLELGNLYLGHELGPALRPNLVSLEFSARCRDKAGQKCKAIPAIPLQRAREVITQARHGLVYTADESSVPIFASSAKYQKRRS